MIFSKEELSEIFHQKIKYDVNDVCINSKEAKYGDMFIAFKGAKTDAHRFVDDAVRDGAVLAVIEDGEVSDRMIKVPSTYDALLKLSRYSLSRADAKYICVTGSVGKTTTRSMISHILASQKELQNKVYSTKRNFNSQIGLPICASCMPINTKIGVFEMGMSEPGDISKLIKIVQPNVSVITKICESHLEYFDSVWEIAKAKSEIFDTDVPQTATVIPADSAYSDFLRKQAEKNNIANIFTFGTRDSDAYIDDVHICSGYCDVSAYILGLNIRYKFSCNNESCIENTLPALLGAHAISGISLQTLADSLKDFTQPDGRGGVNIIGNKDILLIDDSYNACPTSLRIGIQSLSKHTERRKVLIVGDMLELGRRGRVLHEEISATIDKYGIDIVFACGDLCKHLYENLQQHKKGFWKRTSSEIADEITKHIKEGDCVLIKGSHSMNMKITVDKIKEMGNAL